MDPEKLFPRLAVYGHFGRTDLPLPWEALDSVDAIRQG
jgi:S-adenosylmethionine synthetase